MSLSLRCCYKKIIATSLYQKFPLIYEHRVENMNEGKIQEVIQETGNMGTKA